MCIPSRIRRALPILCLFLFLLSMRARANNFYVTNLNDAGAGSLRQAITDANNTATGLPHSIVFNVYGSIVVQSDLPKITSTGLNIDGQNKVTLNTATGGNTIISFLNVGADNVTIRNLTLLNTGAVCFVIDAGTTGVTIQNIVANNFNGPYMARIVYVAGASTNLTLRNITSSQGLANNNNLGYGFFFIGGLQTQLAMDSINLRGSDSSYSGVWFQGAPINGLTLTNSRITGMRQAIGFSGKAKGTTATNVLLDHVTVDSLYSGGYGYYSNYINNGITIRNSLFNSPQNGYGIVFVNPSSGVAIDGLIIDRLTLHNKGNGCWFTGIANNVTITHSSFDNFKGSTVNEMIRFDQPVNNLTMTADSINEEITGSPYSGAYGIRFTDAVTSVSIDSLLINKAIRCGIWVNSTVSGFTLNHSKFTANAVAIDFPGSAVHSGVAVLNSSFLNGTNVFNGAFQFDATAVPNEFRFSNDTIAYNAGPGLRAYNGAVAITDTVTNCVIHDNGYGVLIDNGPTNVVITQNSIFNNTYGGIAMKGSGNCGYNEANKRVPTLVSSTSLGGGQYQLQVSLPNVVAGATYDVDIYANDPNVSAASGQYYVTTLKGLSYNSGAPGTYTINYNKGPGATGQGFWTATLHIPTGSCGTSAFSNQEAMKPQGPGGVSNGIVAWLRADDGQASGAAWADVSGNGAGAYQATATAQPSFDAGVLNFNPALLFNGSSSYMQIPNSAIAGLFPSGASARTLVSVSLDKEGVKTGVIFGYGTPVQGAGNGLAVAGQMPYYWGYSNDLDGKTYPNYLNRQSITMGTYTASGSPNTNLYVNGLFDASGTYTWNTGTTREANIGRAQGSPSYYWNGDIGEVILYNRVLTTTEQQQVNSYLGLKYGITCSGGGGNYLASDGATTFWAANGNYKYRITGVGRDNATSLYQKQSVSVDTGIVTLAVGSSIAASNAVNTATIGTDKSFLVLADDGGATGLTMAVTGTTSTRRMGRVWMVQKTNWADQSITLRIAGAGPNNYLLISTDAVFGSVSQELKLDAMGTITFNSSLLANATYFTVGGNAGGPGNVNTGIALWLRADDGQSTGAVWNDYSGNFNAASQPVAANQASVVLNAFNFNRGLRFNGTTNNLSVPYNAVFNGNVTVYSVYHQLNTGAAFQSPIGSRNSATSTGWNYYTFYTSSNRRDWQTGLGAGKVDSWDIQADGNYTNKQPEMIGLTATPGTGTAGKNMYLNGAPLLATPTTTSTYAVNTTTPLHIGSSDVSSVYWNGDIAEEIVFSRVLTATERQQVESYLALKYGITLNGGATSYLASDGTTKFWDITRNNGYTKHITGIGRDTTTGLYQKQSLGVDTGYLTLALGTAVADANEHNAAVIGADKSFLVAGDNGGAKSFVNNVITSGGTFIALGRAWKVQKTNWTDGNLTLATDPTLPLPQDLLISTDPTFATGVSVLPLSGGVVTLGSGQLPDGAYFTFADTLRAPGGVNTGLGAWWRADAGGSVSAWTDYSGNGHTQLQTAAASQPALQSSVINFNPALYFNGSNFMTSASVFGTGSIQNSTFFAVALPVNSSAKGGLFGESVNNGQILAYSPDPGGSIYFFAPNSAAGDQVVGGAWGGSYGNPYLFAFTRQPAFMNASINNRVPAGVSFSGALVNYTGNNSSFYLGSQTATSWSYNGQIAEMMVYTNTASMTATDRQKIMSYLAFKYGITLNPMPAGGYLASNGTPFWGDATNTGFPFHITGVGRDSVSGLYQRQSVSADTGLVTLALGDTVATSNAANGATIGTDRSFFVFSDNAGSAAYSTPLSGVPGITIRIGRIFKVQKTNWTDQQITIKVSGATSKTYLLVSNDQTFGVGDVAYPFTDSTVHVNSSVLADGAYFTLARRTAAPNAVSDSILLWLRADDGSATGAQWNDQTGNGQNAVQATAGNQPVVDAKAINFNYGLQFNGTTSQMSINSRVSPVNATIFAVASGSGYGSYRDIVSSGSSYGMEFRVTNADVLEYGENAGPGFVRFTGANSITANKVYSFSATQSNSTTNGIRLFENYRLDKQGTFGAIPATDNIIGIGYRTLGNGFNWQGPISEVIIYDKVLSDGQRLKVESYLALKYGLTLNNGAANYLASDSSVYWTANSSYPARITGIGRDDSTQLYTKQSLSVDTGLVTLALGPSIALTNQANTATISKDRSFFVISDNGLSTNNFSTAVTGSTHGVALRYARVWSVQKTNWTDQNITLKVAPLGVQNYLLISNDPGFGSLTQELPLNPDGTVTLSSSLLTNGTYFSFGGPLLAPGGVAGNNLWLRADIGSSASTNGGAVSQWNDQSAVANNVSQSTPANQPVYSDNATDDINFNPVMKFNGSSWLTGSSMLKTNTFTGDAAFTVNSQASSATGSAIFYENSNTSSNYYFDLETTTPSGTNVLWNTPYNTAYATYNPGNINNTVNLWTGSNNTLLTSNRQALYRNDSMVATGNSAATMTGNNSALFVGKFAPYAGSFNGRIPELIIYTSALTATPQQKVNSYLALKYGISLNQATPYDYLATDGTPVWSAILHTNYTTGITGIGRDDAEGLLQLQSRNSDTTRLRIAVGLGEIDSTNSANPNQFSADKSYMTWSDDNGPAGFLTAVSGVTGVNFRMTRVWKVQETGSVGDVLIAIPFTALPSPQSAVLLVSSTNVFDAGSTAYPLNQTVLIGGVKHYAATVDLSSGQYFSFATNVKAPGGIAGASLWLRPDQGSSSTTDGAQVNTWVDYGSQGNTAYQNTQANQPVYADNATDDVNFNPVMRFNSANSQFMNLDVTKLPTGTSARTVFGMGKLSALPSSWSFLISWGTGATSQACELGYGPTNTTAQGSFAGFGNDVTTTSNNFWQAGVFNELMGTWAGSGGNVTLYSKNLQVATPVAKTWNTGTTAARIGGTGWSTESWNGPVGDILVFNRQLSTTEASQVETYLGIRYGYTLNQTPATSYLNTKGSIIWDAAANAAYKNGITGIGYDTTEGLLQKQSRNIDTTRLRIAVGLGEIDSVNSANFNQFGSDASYLIWGDDNGPTAFGTAVSGVTGINYRMTRVWKVQETGSVGNVQIALPFSAVPSARTAVLLVSSTNVFDGSSTAYPLNQTVTIGGVLHYAVTVNLSSGQYFSFAANVKAPGGISGNALWLRADRGISGAIDGASVDTWVDYGSQVNTVAQTTPANQPVYADNGTDDINFNPVVKFNGNNWMTGSSIMKANTLTGEAAFTVNSQASLTAGSAIFYENNSASNYYFDLETTIPTGTNVLWNTPYPTAYVTYNPGNINNTVNLWSGNNNTLLTSNRQALYRNDSLVATGNSATTMTGNNSALFVGKFAPYTGSFNGRIPELAIYTSALTATQQQQVNSYLAIKYGISLNQATLYDYLATDGVTKVWDAAANTTHNYGITGIGRDDAEELLQKQSRNSDTTRLRIVVGLGRIDSTNSANPNNFAADKTYLVWGDDNGVTTFGTAVTGNPIVNYRMSRTWKVQATGTPGSMMVAFPYDVLPNPGQSYLVVSNNQVFDGTDTYIPLTKMTINGKVHWAASFTGGQYFTVAALIKSPGGVGSTRLWLRPDQGIANNTDGGAVDRWLDFANQANSANQTNISNQPAYRRNKVDNINFNPVVKFVAASSQFMNLDVTQLPTGTSARTIFGMGKLSALPSAWSFLISWGTGATNQACELGYGPTNATAQGSFAGYGNDVVTTSNNFWQAGAFNELMGTWAGNGGNATLWSKNVSVAPVAAKSWNTGTTAARVGGTGWSTESWDGTVGDIIVFDRQLGATEMQRVETYLGIRYGYTLDQATATGYLNTNGTPVWNANATYKYNIAGIGRDDAEGLNQLQSRSINAGSILTIGLGDIAADNPSNTGIFNSDTSYVIWGSNSASTTTQTANLPAGYSNTQRMAQQWKIAGTNFDANQQPLSLQFDLTGFTYSYTGANSLVLLIDGDGDGDLTTGGVQQVPLTAYDGANQTVRFDNVTALTDGAVFTLAFIKNNVGLSAKVYLQGAWNGTSMSTTLKDNGLLPATDPYGLNTTPSVSPNSAPVQVVDWVKVEFRDPVTPTTVIGSKAALLLADGTIVDTNYTSTLALPVAPGSYYVAIRHRNHLGIMTAAPIDFSSGPATVDFTKTITPMYSRTNPAQTTLSNGVQAMWGGDANGDGRIMYRSTGNDADWILNNAMSGSTYGYQYGYLPGDVNLDGQVYYISTDNDGDWILYYPLGSNPNGYLEQQLP